MISKCKTCYFLNVIYPIHRIICHSDFPTRAHQLVPVSSPMRRTLSRQIDKWSHHRGPAETYAKESSIQSFLAHFLSNVGNEIFS